MQALSLADDNLMRVRAAIDALGIADKTDIMVVSDHGFATIKLRLVLSEMLVAAGIKQSHESTDIVVVPNGGADLVYLSPTEFPSPESKRAVLQKIVNFAEAQEWCGPIFSRESATAPDEPSRRGRRQRAPKPYLGWIDGTFSQRVIGLYNAARSPDLVISFREEPDADNKHLTGPRQSCVSDWPDRTGLDAKQISRAGASSERRRLRGYRDQYDVHHRHGDAWRGGRARDS